MKDGFHWDKQRITLRSRKNVVSETSIYECQVSVIFQNVALHCMCDISQ